MRAEIANLDTRLSTDIAGVRTELASIETRLIGRMVGAVIATGHLDRRPPASARMTTSKSPAAAAIRSSIRRALRSDDQQPAPITDLQAAVNDALAALDRLERAVKVRPGDDPRLLGLIRGAKDAVRAVADRTA